jgi:hypothetical protein
MSQLLHLGTSSIQTKRTFLFTTPSSLLSVRPSPWAFRLSLHLARPFLWPVSQLRNIVSQFLDIDRPFLQPMWPLLNLVPQLRNEESQLLDPD